MFCMFWPPNLKVRGPKPPCPSLPTHLRHQTMLYVIEQNLIVVIFLFYNNVHNHALCITALFDVFLDYNFDKNLNLLSLRLPLSPTALNLIEDVISCDLA